MHAHAALRTEHSITPQGQPRTRLVTLRSQAPLMLRPTLAKGGEPWSAERPGAVRVSLAAGAAGPVGGDRFCLDIEVGAGSTLVLAEISATLLLPGPHGEASFTRTEVHVASGGTFLWLPEPLIAATGCNHTNEVRIDLAAGARLLAREELLLGRHGEPPGTVRQRLRVRMDGRPLYTQDLDVGPGALGWNSSAVAGRCGAIGSVLVVDPDWTAGGPEVRLLDGDAAVFPLAGPAAVISALADDSLLLRRALDAGLRALGPPWSPP